MYFENAAAVTGSDPRPAEYDDYLLPQPKQKDPIVWRYLTMQKFKWMLQDNGLHLTELSIMEDQYEMKAPPKVRTKIAQWEERVIGHHDEAKWNQIEDEARRSTYVNCWHLNEDESLYMWANYATDKGNDNSRYNGVAIVADYKVLYNHCWFGPHEKHKYFIGQVQYIDWDAGDYNIDNMFRRGMHKHFDFRKETEVRIFVHRGELDLKGIKLPMDLDMLIKEIYIHPLASQEFINEFNQLLRETRPSLLPKIRMSSFKNHVTDEDFPIKL